MGYSFETSREREVGRGVEPVHGVLIAAGLQAVQAGLSGDVRRATARTAATHPRVGWARAARTRIGHVLVALGTFVEGRPECPDIPAGPRPA